MIVDDVIHMPQDDYLGRWQLAERVFRLAESLPAEVPVRVGVYGRWGAGKSSVLSFIRKQATIRDWPVAEISPWSLATQKEMWLHVVTRIELALADANGKASILSLLPELAKMDIGSAIGALLGRLSAAPGGEAAGGKLGTYLLELVSGLVTPQESRFGQSLKERLGTKRLLILVDDLDRAHADIRPQLMLLLRSVLSLSQTIYVLAFDADIVSKALANERQGWEDGYKFLEKIVNFSFTLPEPTRRQTELLVSAALNEVDLALSEKVRHSILDLLPANPRAVKSYLRQIYSVYRAVEGSGMSIQNWRELFLAQLLRTEFPVEAQRIVSDRSLVSDIYKARWDILSKNSGKEVRKETGLEWLIRKDALLSDDRRARLMELLEAMSACASLSDPDDIRELFLLPESAPKLAIRLVEDFITAVLGKSSGELAQELTNRFSGISSQPDEMRNDVMCGLLRVRSALLYRRSSAISERSQRDLMARMADVSRITCQVFDVSASRSGNRSDQLAWLEEVLNQVRRARMERGSIPSDVAHQQGVSLALGISEKLLGEPMSLGEIDTFVTALEGKSDRANQEVRTLWGMATECSGNAALEQKGATLQDLLNRAVLRVLEECFRMVGGMHEVLTSGEGRFVRCQLFDAEGFWLTNPALSALERLVKESETDVVVHENFVVWFLNVRVPEKANREGFSTLLSLVWKAVTSEPVSAMVIKQIAAARSQITHMLGKDLESDLPIPSWGSEADWIGNPSASETPGTGGQERNRGEP